MDILSDFNFIQHIVDPSHVVNLLATLIDHVLMTSNVEVLKTIQTVGLSDHRYQVLEADVSVIHPVEYTLRVCSFWKCPWDEVLHSLHIVPWQVMDIYNNVDDMWSFFYGVLHDCLDTFALLNHRYYRLYMRTGLETDDVMCIMHVHYERQTCVASSDKEKNTI